jgi:hypothetical protein
VRQIAHQDTGMTGGKSRMKRRGRRRNWLSNNVLSYKLSTLDTYAIVIGKNSSILTEYGSGIDMEAKK